MKYYNTVILASIGLYNSLTVAQECPSTIAASGYPAPLLASGWSAHIIANGFTKPRSLKLDSEGHLLVVDQDEENGGIFRLTFEGEAPCLVESDRTQILSNGSVC